jgi:ankyrin repeat protein
MLTLKQKIIMVIIHLFRVSPFIIVLFDIINYIVFKAAYKGHKEVVKELLNHNADICVKDRFGKTVLENGLFILFSIICWKKIFFFLF